MLQMLLVLIKLAALALLAVVTITFTIIAFVRWRRERSFTLFVGLAFASALACWGVWSIDLFHAESTDRGKLAEAFRSNFGFDLPPEVEEIKVKNTFIYDASGHWMTFTYVPEVFDRIIAKDGPLDTATAGSREFNTIVQDTYMKNQNRPDWAPLPTGRTERILFKENFLVHTYSAYYLWIDSATTMVHLHVTYFD